jgi:hypothetical protein
MKKAILTIALLGIAVAAYAGTALGAGTTTGTERGHVRFITSNRCNLVFAFRGFESGTKGRLEISIDGAVVATRDFFVPSTGILGFRLHPYIDPTPDPVRVEYRIGVRGMAHILSGVTLANCDCMPEEGGGDEGGGPGTGSSAPPATPVSSQPGFAG